MGRHNFKLVVLICSLCLFSSLVVTACGDIDGSHTDANYRQVIKHNDRIYGISSDISLDKIDKSKMIKIGEISYCVQNRYIEKGDPELSTTIPSAEGATVYQMESGDLALIEQNRVWIYSLDEK